MYLHMRSSGGIPASGNSNPPGGFIFMPLEVATSNEKGVYVGQLH